MYNTASKRNLHNLRFATKIAVLEARILARDCDKSPANMLGLGSKHGLKRGGEACFIPNSIRITLRHAEYLSLLL